ncbi:fungal-specific transcription factor domain-containing protein [Roridomyces roridus]|uniref:Fungal-specific transcription factor domain-containing protein n=1 Tax=Roridomyces roridus TaxID=1738132 RepID=A0AAD7CEL1_9AGAR|nr:fungal-specific transcription factor domain-containing protein [Roridomyces roridus]
MDSTQKDTKRRKRTNGSCERCKRRKSDVEQTLGNMCSNCLASNSECIVSITVHSVVGEPSLQNSVQPNMSAKEHVAKLLSEGAAYIPDTDLPRILLEVAHYARSLERNPDTLQEESPFSQSSINKPHSPETEQKTSKGDDQLDMYTILGGPLLSARFAKMNLDPANPLPYFGKTSHLELISAAMEAREGFNSGMTPPPPSANLFAAAKRFRRSPWEEEHFESTKELFAPLRFPEPDLLQNLISLYFTRVNPLIFLLHQPTFERSIAAGLHLVDHDFGYTVLAVCALASRCSDDPRVLLQGTNTALSSGWQYFSQLKPFVKSENKLITLYEAQTLCLSMLYNNNMLGSSRDSTWAQVGFGLRCLQEVGVHRRNRFPDKYISEAWKRVFWQLICMDTLASAFTTRPMVMSASDYDTDYPVECEDDDEWWYTPDKITLPKPSLASYTIAYLKLIEILAMAQKTLYLVKESEKPQGWPQNAVAAVDSALNAWIDEVPEHLRWNQDMQNPTFAAQSATIHARYYGIQIHTHRIFIPSSTNKMELSLLHDYPSLAICASSARACSHVMNAFVSRGSGAVYYPLTLNTVFDSALVLLLHVWSAPRNRQGQGQLSVDRHKCLQDVDLCLRVFRFYETKWQIAGFHLDVITRLIGTANTPELPTNIPDNPLKRSADSIVSGGPSTHNQQMEYQLPHSNADENTGFSLPMHTDDLGRMPVYEPFNFNWAMDGSSTYLDGLGWDSGDWSNALTSVDELISVLDNDPTHR